MGIGDSEFYVGNGDGGMVSRPEICFQDLIVIRNWVPGIRKFVILRNINELVISVLD
jgi:hypothetical protein